MAWPSTADSGYCHLWPLLLKKMKMITTNLQSSFCLRNTQTLKEFKTFQKKSSALGVLTWAQLYSLSRFLWRVFLPPGSLTLPTNLVSSANLLKVHSVTLSQSSIQTTNRAGPSTDPWVTPHMTSCQQDAIPIYHHCLSPDIQPVLSPLLPSFKNTLCYYILQAFFNDKKTVRC